MSATFTTAELSDALPALRRFAFSLTRNEDDADDLVQDSVERALAKAHYFEAGTNLKSWLFTLCKRLFLNQMRRRQTQGHAIDIDDAPQSKIAEDASQEISAECRETLERFETLPMRDKVVLSLIVVEGVKYEEAAQILDVPVGTIRSRLSRARARLKELNQQPTIQPFPKAA